MAHSFELAQESFAIHPNTVLPRDYMSASQKVGQTDTTSSVIVGDASHMDCQLLAEAIRHRSRFRVVGSATSCGELISLAAGTEADIAVISARLKDGPNAGLLALRDLRRLHPRTRVIMLLDEEQPELVVDAYREGARGVFYRTTELSTNLRKCILSVSRGQIWISNHQLEFIIKSLMEVPTPRLPSIHVTEMLSKREEEIARLAAAGMSNLEISQTLGLSAHTVKNNLFRTFQKLGISTRIELVLYILSQRKQPELANNSSQRSIRRRSA
jgi:two-component system, NarL family, nitrate/nitrite response regulator NarL